jgi:hypothetical protein
MTPARFVGFAAAMAASAGVRYLPAWVGSLFLMTAWWICVALLGLAALWLVVFVVASAIRTAWRG